MRIGVVSDPTKSSKLDEFLSRVDIVDVAIRLALHVDKRLTRPRRAICPFHNDTTPSLNLYEGSGNAHYHCFACGAHGDVIGLVRGVKGGTFREAIDWLGDSFGFRVEATRPGYAEARSATSDLSNLITESRSQRFDAISEARGFNPTFLRGQDVGLTSLDPLIERGRRDRPYAEALVEAGIGRRVEVAVEQNQFWHEDLKGFYTGERVVFRIDAANGGIAGFAARALADEKPKYLYNRGFKRGETLYGAHDTLRSLVGKKKHNDDVFTLQIVEGIFDALRLKALGFPAVAVLGSTLSQGQSAILAQILPRAQEIYKTVQVDLFLDSDEAGRAGAATSLTRLIALQAKHGPFAIRVIIPHEKAGTKSDPDSYLRGLDSPAAEKAINDAAIPALVFLANHFMRRSPRLPLGDSSASERAMAARRIAEGTDARGLRIFVQQLETNDVEASFVDTLRVFMPVFAPSQAQKGIEKDPSPKTTPDDRSELLTALALCRPTTIRREYPFDDASWHRLATAASALFHVHAARLADADAYGPSTPYLARHTPKSDGSNRLKCGPAAEDLLLQQYVLQGLLRTHAAAREVSAVRYDSTGLRTVTGPLADRFSDPEGKPEPVSFAYQIDMAIVDGVDPQRREGLFRSYFDCWRDFVDHVDRRLARMSCEVVHVLRLDISAFYDHLRRTHVREALQASVRKACEGVAAVGSCISPLLLPLEKDPAARADAIVDFLLRHSFGFPYWEPVSGNETRSSYDFGLPQGPDLSAYLANIALFELDAIMADEIRILDNEAGDGARGGAYARYVDDMVLVCPDALTARRLQRKIEAYLSKFGLRLNRKNTPPPPMTRREARLWITNSRTGLGFSGPLAETLPLALFNPPADLGDVVIGRKLALGLLHDPALDDAEIYGALASTPINVARRQNALDRIASALSAQELRYNDRVNAYRRLWLMAAGDETGIAIAQRFVVLVNSTDKLLERRLTTIDARERAFAAFDAMERVMRIELSVDEAETRDRLTLVTLRNKLALAQPHELADAAVSAIFEFAKNDAAAQRDAFLDRYDVATQRLVIVNAAFSKVTSLSIANTMAIRRRHPLIPFGSLWTTLWQHEPSAATPPSFGQVERSEPSRVVFATLHQDIAAIEAWGANGEDEIRFAPGTQISASPLLQTVRSIRSVWLNEPLVDAGERERDAAAALINLASRRLNDLFPKWPQLLRLLRGMDNQPLELEKIKAIPQPPGLKVDAALFIYGAKGQLSLILVEFGERLARIDATERAVVGVAWPAEPQGLQGVDNLRVYEAPLLGYEPMIETIRTASPAEIARTYRGLLKALSRSISNGYTIVPTAYSFFSRPTEALTGATEYQVIAWKVEEQSVDGHAFVREGNGLQVRTVHERDASFWRFGWAVCDLFEHAGNIDREDDADGEDPFDHRDQIVHAIVHRTARRLIGRDRWGAGKPGKDGEPPSRIARALSFLEAHSEAQSAAAAATIAAAAYAEGSMAHERIERSGQYWRPGGLAALLRRASMRGVRGLRRAATVWQPPSQTDISDLRRGTAAWFALGERVAREAAGLNAGPEEHDPNAPARFKGVSAALASLSAGCRLEGLTTGVRRFVLDLVAMGGDDTQAHLDMLVPDIGDLEARLGPNAVLVETEEIDLKMQCEALRDALIAVVTGKPSAYPVTPLGWTILAGILLNVLPRTQIAADLLRPLPVFPPHAEQPTAEAIERLIALTALVCEPAKDEDQEPQDVFLPYVAIRDQDWEEAKASLRALDTAIGLRTQLIETRDEPLRVLGDQRGQRIRLSWDGAPPFDIEAWRIGDIHLPGDRGQFEFRRDGDKPVFRLSVTFLGSTPLSCDLLSRQLADTSFGVAGGEPTNLAPPADPTDHIPYNQILRENVPTGEKGHRNKKRIIVANPPESELDRTLKDRAPPVSSPPHKQDTLKKEIQKSWAKRKKASGMHRMALLQWDVTDSYFFPDHRNGEHEGLVAKDRNSVGSSASLAAINNPDPNKRIALPAKVISVHEYRRRKILEAALDACIAFEVEGLVLPEYSVRPETVNWLVRRMSDQAEFPKAIWAGSFRVPCGDPLLLDRSGLPTFRYKTTESGTTEDIPDFTAVIPCVYRVPDSAKGVAISTKDTSKIKIEYRSKRHPSIAADELIRPSDLDWQPLFTDIFWGHTHLQTFTAELVCSEIFLHASSGNIPGAIAAADRLRQKLGVGGSVNLKETIIKEIIDFSRYTSLQEWPEPQDRAGDLQRTIVVVPAMTSRSADYHIFGQNHHLASRLITVFASAVCEEAGCGESCFIGLDGWREMDVKDTPYGDVGPGIFHFKKDSFGPLGRQEAAMVIADIQPIHSTDQKPRPQFQPRALKLVAHLPLIFATKNVKNAIPAVSGDYPVGNRIMRYNSIGKGTPPPDFMSAITEAIDSARAACKNGDFSDGSLTKALLTLEAFADDPAWLTKRRKALQERSHLFPHRDGLPPSLTDWIFVDDAWPIDPETLARFGEAANLQDDDPWLEFPSDPE